MTEKTLKIGEVVIKDYGPLGLSIYVGNEQQIWFNSEGETELMKWIAVKHGMVIRTPETKMYGWFAGFTGKVRNTVLCLMEWGACRLATYWDDRNIREQRISRHVQDMKNRTCDILTHCRTRRTHQIKDKQEKPTMNEWQTRVVQEKNELEEKRTKLHQFLQSHMFPLLTPNEYEMLQRQYVLMKLYSDVLGERIKAFE